MTKLDSYGNNMNIRTINSEHMTINENDIIKIENILRKQKLSDKEDIIRFCYKYFHGLAK
jgi:hypothetical protein